MVNIITGTVLSFFGVFVIIMARKFPSRSIESGLGADAFPLLCGIALLVLSILMVIRSVIAYMKERQSAAGDSANVSVPVGTVVLDYLKKLKPVILFVAVFFLYISFLRTLGYLICTPILLFCVMKIMKARNVLAIIIALSFTGGIYLVFRILLNVPLPGLRLF